MADGTLELLAAACLILLVGLIYRYERVNYPHVIASHQMGGFPQVA